MVVTDQEEMPMAATDNYGTCQLPGSYRQLPTDITLNSIYLVNVYY
jgi:hypothetical protein